MRIVVFCPNPIGDAVMATPALRALRDHNPDAVIDAVMRPVIVPTLVGVPWIDERIRFDPRSDKPELRSRAIIRRLRNSRYDLAVLFPNSFRTGWIAWRAGIPRRVGDGRGGRSILLTSHTEAPKDQLGRFLPSPAVDSYLNVVRLLGAETENRQLELFTSEADRSLADRVWGELGLPSNGSVVCLNTGGAFGPAKSWPVEHFATLARRLVMDADRDVLVLCGPDEREAAREIARQAGHRRVVSLADHPPSIGLSKASIQRCALLVTTDSGPRHFATAFQVPVVTLFGPTFIAWTRTYHPRALHLQQPVPCGPCQKAVCPEGHHRCMKELTPETVFNAALKLLGDTENPSESPRHRPHVLTGIKVGSRTCGRNVEAGTEADS